jgi:hypothetical protein
MRNLFSRVSIFLVWATFLALLSSCQSQTSIGSTPPIAVTPTQASSVERPSPTPSSAPDHEVETTNAGTGYHPFPYEEIDDFGQTKSDKFSGVVFYPQRETLLAVTDNGQIVEIKTDGTFIRRKLVRDKADFEGITYSPITEMLYVAIEGEEVI